MARLQKCLIWNKNTAQKVKVFCAFWKKTKQNAEFWKTIVRLGTLTLDLDLVMRMLDCLISYATGTDIDNASATKQMVCPMSGNWVSYTDTGM